MYHRQTMRTTARVVLALTMFILAASAPVAGRTVQSGLISYTLTAHWPKGGTVTLGPEAFINPVSVDAAPDGRIYVSDPGARGIHTIWPDGHIGPVFGATEDGPARLGSAGKLAVGPVSEAPDAEWRVYVLDEARSRIVVYSQDGAFVDEWPGAESPGIAVDLQGRVYAADRNTGQIVVRDSNGAEIFRQGARGTDDGQFTGFVDLDTVTTTDGGTSITSLAVVDRDKLRVQLFQIDLAQATHKRSIDLTHPHFRDCDASGVQLISPDEVMLGVSGRDRACRVTPEGASGMSLGQRASANLCDVLSIPRVSPDRALYLAMSTFDPRPGTCARKDKFSDLKIVHALAVFADDWLRFVVTVHPGAEASSGDLDDLLIAPASMSLGASGLFVSDQGGSVKIVDTSGSIAESLPGSTRDESGMKFVLTNIVAGTTKSDEILGNYERYQRYSIGYYLVGSGVGRFRRITLPSGDPDRDYEVLESVWTKEGQQSLSLCTDSAAEQLVGLMIEYSPELSTYKESIRRWSMVDGAYASNRDIVLRRNERDRAIADLACDSSGRLYVHDRLASEVNVLESDGSPVRRLLVSRDAIDITVAPDSTLFLLRSSGVIERIAADGQVVARFDARPNELSAPESLVSIAAADNGRVFSLDRASRVVSVFDPASDADGALPADGECAFRSTKDATPQIVDLGDSIDLELSLSGQCGALEVPSDLMIVIPQYLPFATYGGQVESPVVTEVNSLLSRMDIGRHRVGIVSYLITGYLEQELTDKRQSVEASLRSLKAPPPRDPFGSDGRTPQLVRGITLAARQFDFRDARPDILWLYRPSYCYPENHYAGSTCAGILAAEQEARDAQAAGATIVVVSPEYTWHPKNRLPDAGGAWPADADHLASSDADVIKVAYQARVDAVAVRRRLLPARVPDHLATDLRLTDRTPANMPIAPSSAIPPPAQASGDSVEWRLPVLDPGGGRFGLRVTPQQVGRWPTNTEAVAEFTDGWGMPQRIVFPVPEVEVVAPEPTPAVTPPLPTATQTATPEPPPTAMPTRGSTPSRAYLPLALHGHCLPSDKRVDVVLVVDASSSMAGAKLTAAQAALARFLGYLELGADRAALITFAEDAQVALGLSVDHGALTRAFTSIETREGTRIDAGIHKALDLLAVRDGARDPVIVLLSDGRQADATLARAAGSRARDESVEVYAIGLGGDVDTDLLRSLGTDGPHYHFADRPEELAAVFERVVSVQLGSGSRDGMGSPAKWAV